MRTLLPSVLCGALLLTAGSASAASYYLSNGTYFISGGPDSPEPIQHVRANGTGGETAFFTPIAGYQRDGYQCVPLVELTKVNGRLSRRQGTACRSLNAR